MRDAAARGLIDPGDGDVEAYVRERVARHREPGEPFLQRRGDGRWILISERRTAAGGTVAVYSDMTELKRREIELNELAEQQRAAAEQVACKNRELEALSNKLAKYLAPQVYASIFAGRQEVRLASQRKKLSVLFCDIVGFTETTERLESEDLDAPAQPLPDRDVAPRPRPGCHGRQVHRRRDHDVLRRPGEPRGE